MIAATDFNFNQAAFTCQQDQTNKVCIGNNYFDLKSTIKVTVSGHASACCYNLSIGAQTELFAPGGEIKLVYQYNTGAYGMNATYKSTWTVFVDGQASASCTLAEWPSTTITCT